MLQQTQVATVATYFPRFVDAFPDVVALANAELDAVLRLWAGLGYYARARNLHRAAQIVRDVHNGVVPADHAVLHSLPGIGRSTAGAILALSMEQRWPILDANVKRVLTRVAAIVGWPGQSSVQATLWALADKLTPAHRVAHYTQAMMDIGALICLPRRPQCLICPLADQCVAHTQGRAHDFPTGKPRRAVPVRTTRMLLLCWEGRVLLEKRPPTGIWGGLWSVPECPAEMVDAAEMAQWCAAQWGLTVVVGTPWPMAPHVFTHFRLEITPVPVEVMAIAPARVAEGQEIVWCAPDRRADYAMAPPVQRLLSALETPFQPRK